MLLPAPAPAVSILTLTYSLVGDCKDKQVSHARGTGAYKQQEESRDSYLIFSPLLYNTCSIVAQSERM